jgi:ATP-dependent RNA helicase DHX29
MEFYTYPQSFYYGPQWKHASSSVNNRRGKKNLVLSSWGDESTLSEGYINPHYTSDYYKTYSERTNQNLVSSIL